jgi:hypothetical protein
MSRRTQIAVFQGAFVSAMAACASLTAWHTLRDSALSASADGAAAAGWFEGLLAGVVGLGLVPLLLWATMRLLGRTDTHLLLFGGTAAWWLIGAHLVEDADSGLAAAAWVAAFAATGGLLSGARLSPAQQSV